MRVEGEDPSGARARTLRMPKMWGFPAV